jgi:hypothetical protein
MPLERPFVYVFNIPFNTIVCMLTLSLASLKVYFYSGCQSEHGNYFIYETNSTMKLMSVKVACLQETKLSARSKQSNFPDYTHVRKDRPAGGGGGLVILIHHSVSFTHIDVSALTDFDLSLELLAVCIEIGSFKLDVYNVYLPPASSCPTGHRTVFTTLFASPSNDALILGDFNAHHASWYSPCDPSDLRGDQLASVLDSSNLCILNSDTPTRLPSNNYPSPSPDISRSPSPLSIVVRPHSVKR